MKKASNIFDLMILVDEMSTLRTKCELIPDLAAEKGIPVKTEDGILESLKNQFELVDSLFEDSKEIKEIKKSMKKRINYFKREYLEKKKILSLKFFDLDEEDAEELLEDIEWWEEELFNSLDLGTILIKEEETFESFFDDNLINKLSKNTKNDLEEGFNLLQFRHPTSASMILFRAAEAITNQYYEQTTNRKPGKISWNKVLDELEEKRLMRKALVGYLHFIRDKRNDAAHPGKQFKQTEAEQILMHIRSLLEEI